MATLGWILLGALVFIVMLVLGAALVSVLWQQHRQRQQQRRMEQARAEFRRQREMLEARFFTLASESGRPRGLAWKECDFGNDVTFARDKNTGELHALVGVNISFEAIEGGGMEDNPNVGRVRAATAVFRRRNDAWQTDGRAIMNFDPQGAIVHFQNELETVD